MNPSRRKWLRNLGLSAAGTPLLYSIAGQLLDASFGAAVQSAAVQSAIAQTLPRRTALFVVIGETLPMLTSHGFLPSGVVAGDNLGAPQPAETWDAVDAVNVIQPAMFAPLAAHHQRLLVVDGLFNDVGGGVQHGYGYSALSGVRSLVQSPETGGRPAAPTLDQLAVKGLQDNTPIPEIAFGFVGDLQNHPNRIANTFAAGKNDPIFQTANPAQLKAQLFGAAAASGAAQDPTDAVYRQRLLDSMRSNIHTLQTRLAAEERERLDHYLQHIDTFDKKQSAVTSLLQADGCNASPTPDLSSAVARLTSMYQMAALAVRCGLSNVSAVSIGHGFGHDDLQCFNPFFGPAGYHSHGDPVAYDEAVGRLYQLNAQLIAEYLEILGPLANETLVMLTAGSGASFGGHHASATAPRFPVIVLDGAGELNTGSRYIRFAKNERSVIDLYSSLSHVLRAPDDAFNAGTNQSRGPILEIMA